MTAGYTINAPRDDIIVYANCDDCDALNPEPEWVREAKKQAGLRGDHIAFISGQPRKRCARCAAL